MGYYPQTPNDECLLDNFRDVVYKYRTLCLDGLIVKPKNGVYPRLCISHQRGERAGRPWWQSRQPARRRSQRLDSEKDRAAAQRWGDPTTH